MTFAILYFVEQCQLVLRIFLYENLADRLVDLAVHFQDVCLGYLAFLARFYHAQHAAQLYPAQQIFLWILLECSLAHVVLVKLRAFRMLVVRQYEVRIGCG